ncbi:hypothetical protein BOTBODRAFT_28743 [Botryobasidium botryosum FD-172 SS1]|uniref:Protein kinase domain-containing protein n=1 Tax=Botryobasidium botryosum (strain FD-172 SS1) TaxID=930990 RepID=A0A067MRY1_BOTB1|nr:hypothetical protein BOTBODRAFT_28743 [Botryobasidium botryosum FD-172 SS1]
MPISNDPRTSGELFWVNLHPFLLSHGYQLRPRYNPKWTPSWLQPEKKIKPYLCEDSLNILKWRLLDAIRLKDGSKVVLKCMHVKSDELRIALYLSSPQMQGLPGNRTVPVIDVIKLPDDADRVLLVMPYLRVFDKPRFHCQGEVVGAFRQFLQGLVFMHEHNVAHRDIGLLNLMMDESVVMLKASHFCRPWTHDGCHGILEWRNRCSSRLVDYYYIDFDLSTWYPGGQKGAVALGKFGQVKTVPELSDTIPYDPFKVDIYQLGYTLAEVVMMYPQLSFMLALCRHMMHCNPNDRPTASAALAEFEEIVSGIDPRSLGTPIYCEEDKRSIWYRYDTLFERVRCSICPGRIEFLFAAIALILSLCFILSART